MAEGFAKNLGINTLDAWSAGSKPSGKVNETAVAVMKEKGIDLNTQASKSLSDIPRLTWDYVITMGCGDACPFVPSKKKEDWEIPDPKHLPLGEFRKIRDQIERKINQLIHDIATENQQVSR